MRVPLSKRAGNMVRLGEVVHVLVSNGFAHLVHANGLSEGLPAKLLTELSLLEKREESQKLETVGLRLCRVFSQLGPTFVKLGQILATRPDLLDAKICSELEELQDRAPTVEFAEVRPQLESELGRPISEAFQSFDETPIAAASISQVYKATRKDGTPVAVKVQRPGIFEVIEADLSLLRALAGWIGKDGTLGLSDPESTVDEFARSIRRELDFDQERRVLERFRSNFVEENRIVIPQVYPDTSSRRVLTMSWIDGVRVDNRAQYEQLGADPKVIARLGCEIICRQVFEHRFFHADPHPGNIILTKGAQIAFLDYGMVGHLGLSDVEAMADLLRAVMEQDAETCVRITRDFTTSGYLEDPRTLQHEIAEYLAFEAQAVVDQGRVGEAIQKLTDILRRYRLELAPRFGLLLKSLATIESTAHALDPDLQIVPILQPFIETLFLNRLSPAEIASRTHGEMMSAFRSVRSLPDDVKVIASQIRRGKLSVNHQVQGMRELSEVIDRAASRMSFALVMSSLVIGSSWLLASNVVADNLGRIGLIIAIVIGAGLTVSMLRGVR